MTLWLLSYLINNSHYCWESYARCKDHLESAKCIGELSATSPLIPPKLYLLVVPPLFFKQLRIISCKTARKIYDAQRHAQGGSTFVSATWKVLFVTRRSCPKQDESQGQRPCDLRTVVRKFSSAKCPVVSFWSRAHSLVRFSTSEKRTSPSWQELRDRCPPSEVNSRVSKLSIANKLCADGLAPRSL